MDYEQIHRDLWNWLADNPGNKKEDWPGWRNLPLRFHAHCAACEYVKQTFGLLPNDTVPCGKCPITWPETQDPDPDNPPCVDSHFGDWCDAYEAGRDTVDYARKIADMPWNVSRDTTDGNTKGEGGMEQKLIMVTITKVNGQKVFMFLCEPDETGVIIYLSSDPKADNATIQLFDATDGATIVDTVYRVKRDVEMTAHPKQKYFINTYTQRQALEVMAAYQFEDGHYGR